MAPLDARFGHVNVTGRDWRRLAPFYTDVFDAHPGPRVDRPSWGYIAFHEAATA